MPQQDYYTRTLYLMTPNARVVGGTDEDTALDAGTTADTKFVHIRCKSAATSGDTRGMYTCLYMNGAGQAGEAVRARVCVNAAVSGGVHGLHGGVDMNSSGSIGGLAAGVRGTFYPYNAATSGGSVYGMMSELYAHGSDTDFTDFTNHAIHRFVVDGQAAGKNTAAYCFEFSLPAAGGMYCASATCSTMAAAMTKAIKIKLNGSDAYIPIATATT